MRIKSLEMHLARAMIFHLMFSENKSEIGKYKKLKMPECISFDTWKCHWSNTVEMGAV
jgi:hypothetical protein